MSDFRDYLNEQLKDPEFRAEWDALEPEFQIVRAMIDAREKKHLSQKELSNLTGISQADISRLENGNANPSIRTLQRLAAGMGMRVKIEFQPIQSGN
nr:MAG TPA: helix-turn-helix domain protein [Caudoviricetes sp.]